MKKILIFALSAISALFLMSFTTKPCADQHQSGCVISESIAAAKTVTVYKITRVGQTGAFSTQSMQAEFDQSKMELSVVEKRNGKNHTMTYSVVRNPYKGYSDDPRGRYDYCADCYFFN